MPFPPHLPQKNSPLVTWDRARLWIWFLLGIFGAFVASVAGTLSTLAWIAPESTTVPTLLTSRRERSPLVTAAYIDPLVLQQVQQRLVQVYDRRQKIRDQYYTASAKIGEAVLLTREGWAVLPLPALSFGEEKNFEVVDFQGNVFTAETSTYDSVSGLAYIKIVGSGFRGDAVFPDWRTLDVDTPVLAIQGSVVQDGYIEGTQRIADQTFPLWQSGQVYLLSATLTPGSVVVTATGEFVGFVREDRTLIPSWQVSAHLRSLFASEKIVYESVPLIGQELSARSQAGRFEERSGFLVTASPFRVTSSTVGVGDTVVRVEGELYHPIYTAQLLSDQVTPVVTLTVLRGDNEVDISVPRSVIPQP